MTKASSDILPLIFLANLKNNLPFSLETRYFNQGFFIFQKRKIVEGSFFEKKNGGNSLPGQGKRIIKFQKPCVV